MTNLISTVFSARCRTIAYWVTTVLVAAESAVGGVWDIMRTPYVRTIIEHLGYPSYFLLLTGRSAMVPPRPKLKETNSQSGFQGSVPTVFAGVPLFAAETRTPPFEIFVDLIPGTTPQGMCLRVEVILS